LTAEMSDARKLLFTRGVRGLADGLVSVALATYLTGLGFNAFEVGAIVTGTLLGSAAVTLSVGLLGYRLSRRRILLVAWRSIASRASSGVIPSPSSSTRTCFFPPSST